MLKSLTRLAATSSWVESGLEATKHEVGAAGLEGPGQVGRLGRHVQAGRHPQARQRLLALEPLLESAEDGHVPLRPEDALEADARQGQILHVTSNDGRQGDLS